MDSVSGASSRPPSPASLLEEIQWESHLELPRTGTSVFTEEISDQLVSDLASNLLPKDIGSVIVFTKDADDTLLKAVQTQLMRSGNYISFCEQIGPNSFEQITDCLSGLGLGRNVLILAPHKEEADFLAACLWVSQDAKLPDPPRFGQQAVERSKQAGIVVPERFQQTFSLFAAYLLGELKVVPFLKESPKLPPKPLAPSRLKTPQSQPKKEEAGCCSCLRWLWTRKSPEKEPLLQKD